MRILALYLPQFHEVRENNEWWGDGFTEWTNVRNATPVFTGHTQPVHPLGHRYYDLSDPAVLVWQAGLAREFGVSGFVFFHYWSSGKMLLEKPVDLWRQTPSAELDYCLCWANHPWTRAWDGKDHDVLQAQTYGEEEDWDSHFDYLLPFFQDPRYLKKDGRPLFFIYNAGAIPRVDNMVQRWNARLAEAGLGDVYLVEYISTKNPDPSCSMSQAVYEDEPLFTCRFEISRLGKAKRLLTKKLNLPDFQDYESLWRLILGKRRRYGHREIVQGAFVAWDNSPRRGKRGSLIVRGSTPEGFGRYLHRLVNAGRPGASKDYLVVNAWNEWGEGAILEPTEEMGHRYLQALRDVVSAQQSG